MSGKPIELCSINIEGKTQQRSLCLETQQAYAEAMKAGEKFPPLEVVQEGENFWLWDGFHRFHAMQSLGYTTAEVNVTPGTQRTAIELSLRANTKHGLPRDKQAKLNAIRIIESDSEWRLRTDKQKAEMCGMNEITYRRYRNEIPDFQSPQTDIMSVSGQNGSETLIDGVDLNEDKIFQLLRRHHGEDFTAIYTEELANAKWQLGQASWQKFYLDLAMEEKIDSQEKMTSFVTRQISKWTEPDGACCDGAIARAFITGMILRSLYGLPKVA